MDKVAVLMSVYQNDNALHFKESIESVLNQENVAVKLFLGVDGPIKHDLEEVICHYVSSNKICLIRFKENRGLAFVLNRLLSECLNQNFEYLARMDADDVSKVSRFFKQVNFLKENTETDVVGSAISEINEYGFSRNKTIYYPSTNDECLKFFRYRNPLAHPAVMFKSSFFLKLGHAYSEDHPVNQDTILWLEGFKSGCRFSNIREVLLDFRINESFYSKRRQGIGIAKLYFKDRLRVARDLNFGFISYLSAFMSFLLILAPPKLKAILYKLR